MLDCSPYSTENFFMAIFNSILETIGNTPLVRINKLNKGEAEVYVKL